MKRLRRSYRKAVRRILPLPDTDISIPSMPSEPAEPEKPGFLTVLGPMAGSLVMSLGMLIFYKNSLYPLIMMSSSTVYALITYLRYRGRRNRYLEDVKDIRAAYLRRIEEIEATCRSQYIVQKQALQHNHPSCEDILGWVQLTEGRVWERSAGDADFLVLRIGKGRRRASFSIKLPNIHFPELVPAVYLRPGELADIYSQVENVPITISLLDHPMLAVVGPLEMRTDFLRAVLCQAAGLHAPSDLEIAMILPNRTASRMEWAKWLPHCGAFAGRYPGLASTPEAGQALLTRLYDERTEGGHPHAHLLMIVDEEENIRFSELYRALVTRSCELRVSMIYLASHPTRVPREFDAVITIRNEQRAVVGVGSSGGETVIEHDTLAVEWAAMISRRLAGLDDEGDSLQTELPESIRLLGLMGIEPDKPDLEQRWENNLRHPPSLSTVVGMRAGSRPLILDLSQAKAGPHGLIAGTTGSGKSELLLTLLTGLALNHHPNQIQFLLVDYKGGTAMSVLAGLPHTLGLVTDLDGRQTIRALKMLSSEMQRREQILTEARVADIDKYHRAGFDTPLPYLFVVIDEFAELRDHFHHEIENVMDKFISVAQKGRALGVHLIIAMQKPEGVVNDRIRANMKFRICLRVERPEDSKNVIGTRDAYLLPANPPGRAYFRVGNNDHYEQFQVARIAGQYAGTGCKYRDSSIYEIKWDGSREQLIVGSDQPGLSEQGGTPRVTEAEMIVRKAEETALKMGLQPLQGPWMEPLPERVDFLALQRRFHPESISGKGWMGPPVPVALGLVDDPARQSQFAYEYIPENGNLLAVGAPGSGRTTLVQTLLSGLARTRRPDQLHIHIIDFAGHSLRASFEGYPHLGGVYEAMDEERTAKLLRFLMDTIERRRELFLEHMASNMVGYNRGVEENERLPHVLVVIHNFQKFRETYIDEVEDWAHLLREGPSYGIVFLITSDQCPSTQVLELARSRIVLPLSDRGMYSMLLGSRIRLDKLPDKPGRGYAMLQEPLEVQIASPAKGPDTQWIEALHQAGQEMAKKWAGPCPPRIRALPDRIIIAEINQERTTDPEPDGIPGGVIGLDGEDLQAVRLELDRIPRTFLVSGPPVSGKSTTLQTLLHAFGCIAPEQEKSVLVISHAGGMQQINVEPRFPGGLEWLDINEDPGLDRLEPFFQSMEPAAMKEKKQRRAHFLVIDDLERTAAVLNSRFGGKLDRMLSPDAPRRFWLFAAQSLLALQNRDPLTRRLRKGRGGILLVSTDPAEAMQLGVKIPRKLRGRRQPQGRGIYYDPSGQKVIQIALPYSNSQEV